MNNPLVTIGLSCYNVENYVDFAIRSIINQTYKNWELIIIDDLSIDDTVKRLSIYSHHPKIKIIIEATNKGLSYRLNQIANLANGKYLVRMDADDIMEVTRLEKQVAFLEISHDDLIGSHAYSINTNNEVIGKKISTIKNSDIAIVSQGLFIHPTVMGKTSWFISNPYSLNCLRIEDLELWLRTHSYSKFQILNEALLFYREGEHVNKKNYLLSKINYYKAIQSSKEIRLIVKVGVILKELTKGFVFYLIGNQNFLSKNRFVRIREAEKWEAKIKLQSAIKL